MAKNRKKFVETIKKMLNEIDPGNPSIDIIIDSINKMSAQQLEEYVNRLRNGVSNDPDHDKPREIIPIVVPTLANTKINITRNVNLMEKWGVKLSEKIWMTDAVTGFKYLSNQPYSILTLPVYRQSQTIEKKMTYSKADNVLDGRTGAPAKSVNGASLSAPELQSLLSQGREKAAIEAMKFRGGDDKAYRTMAKSLLETGSYSQDSYKEPTRAKSTDVASIYLKAMHIDNDL